MGWKEQSTPVEDQTPKWLVGSAPITTTQQPATVSSSGEFSGQLAEAGQKQLQDDKRLQQFTQAVNEEAYRRSVPVKPHVFSKRYGTRKPEEYEEFSRSVAKRLGGESNPGFLATVKPILDAFDLAHGELSDPSTVPSELRNDYLSALHYVTQTRDKERNAGWASRTIGSGVGQIAQVGQAIKRLNPFQSKEDWEWEQQVLNVQTDPSRFTHPDQGFISRNAQAALAAIPKLSGAALGGGTPGVALMFGLPSAVDVEQEAKKRGASGLSALGAGVSAGVLETALFSKLPTKIIGQFGGKPIVSQTMRDAARKYAIDTLQTGGILTASALKSRLAVEGAVKISGKKGKTAGELWSETISELPDTVMQAALLHSVGVIRSLAGLPDKPSRTQYAEAVGIDRATSPDAKVRGEAVKAARKAQEAILAQEAQKPTEQPEAQQTTPQAPITQGEANAVSQQQAGQVYEGGIPRLEAQIPQGTIPKGGEGVYGGRPEKEVSPKGEVAVEPSPFQRRVQDAVSSVPSLRDATVRVDDVAKTATIQLPHGATTIHFDADAKVEAIAKRKGKKAKGAYAWDTSKGGYGDIYLRSDATANTLNHEVIHWLEHAEIITKKEVNAVGGSEAFAQKYSRWVQDKRSDVPSGVFKRTWDFIRRILGDKEARQDVVFADVENRTRISQLASQAKPAATAPATTETQPPEIREGIEQPPSTRTYSIKNAAMEQLTGKPEPPTTGRVSHEERVARAAKASDAEIDSLLAKLEAKPKLAATADENAMMARRVAELGGQLEKSPDAETSARIEDQLYRIQQISKRTGTAQAQDLESRKIALENNFSLPNRIVLAREANAGKPLTSEELAEIAKDTREITDLETKHEEYLTKQIEERAAPILDRIIAETPPAPKYHPKLMEYAEKYVQWLEQKAGEADRVWRDYISGAIPQAGLPVKVFEVLAIKGAAKLARGTLTAAEWTAEMVAELGPKFKEHATEIYQHSLKILERGYDAGMSPVTDRATTIKAIRHRAEKVKSGNTIEAVTAEAGRQFQETGKITGQMVNKLAKKIIENGTRSRNMVAAQLHNILKQIDPNITPKETFDLISGYGVTKPLKKDAISITIRDIRGQLQQLAKLSDMRRKTAPQKTGPERRTPSEKERQLIKQVNEAKKKGGYVVTDPETQLRSAMDAAKRATQNRINELTEEINTGKRIVGNKTTLIPDAELTKLRQARDELLVEHAKVFPKQPATEAQRIAAEAKRLDRLIAQMEADLAAGKIGRKGKTTKLSAPILKAKRARLDELKSIREEMRAADPEFQRSESARDELAYKRHLQKRLADIMEKEAQPDSAELFAKTPRKKRVLDEELNKEEVDILEQIQKTKNRLQTREEYFRWRNLTGLEKTGERLLGAYNLSREIVLGLEGSFLLMQGGPSAFAHPIRTLKSLPDTFSAFFSERGAFESELKLQRRVRAKEYKKYEVEQTVSGGRSTKAEESTIGKYTNYVPIVRNFARASVQFMNRLRADQWDALAKRYEQLGGTSEKGKEKISGFVGDWTGRSKVFGRYKAATVLLNDFLLAPRWWLSRIKIAVGPLLYWGDPIAWRVILEEYGRMALGAAAVYGAFSLMGGKVITDPDHPKLGQVQFGNQWFDPLGGLLQLPSLIYRLVRNKERTATGDIRYLSGPNVEYGQNITAMTRAGSYLRSKLAIGPGALLSGLTGENPVGEETNLAKEAVGMYTPIYLNNLYDALQAKGVPTKLAFAIMMFIGIRSSRYDPTEHMKETKRVSVPRLPKPRLPKP